MIDVLDKQRQGLDPKLKEIVDDEDRESRDYVVCATCSHIIARKTDRIDVNGSMDHYLTNPYGLEFHVGCFTEAFGCSISGTRVAADTWFSGFQWRLASCAECRHHLGWYFDQSGSHFYGLVLTYIQDA